MLCHCSHHDSAIAVYIHQKSASDRAGGRKIRCRISHSWSAEYYIQVTVLGTLWNQKKVNATELYASTETWCSRASNKPRCSYALQRFSFFFFFKRATVFGNRRIRFAMQQTPKKRCRYNSYLWRALPASHNTNLDAGTS